MSLRRRLLLLCASLAVVSLCCPRLVLSQASKRSKDTLDLVGNPAPTLSVDHWLKGEPVELFEPGMVYVVEFWGTWCGPCIKNIPHLSALQDEYDENQLIVIAAATHEFDEFEVLERFMEKRGADMRYRVAFDADLSMESDWQTGGDPDITFRMPEAYVIDGTGTITWAGHPEYQEEFHAAVRDAVQDARSSKDAVR